MKAPVHAADDSTLQSFPDLDAATEAALRSSIERHGVLVPVAIDQDDRILDGHHRSRIAKELDVPYPTITHWVTSDDHARELARTLNEDRRQLSAEQRRPVVADLREQGHSVRAISGAVGVSKSQVARDVAQVSRVGQVGSDESEVSRTANLPPAPEAKAADPAPVVEPQRVKGLDGKSYPAKRPMPELDPGEKARRARQSEQLQAHLNLTNALLPLNPDPIGPERYAPQFAESLGERLAEFEPERLEKAAAVLLALVEIRRSM